MIYDFEEENNKISQKLKDEFIGSFKDKMPKFNKGMWYLYVREEVEQVENAVIENLFDEYGYENVFGGKYCNKKR